MPAAAELLGDPTDIDRPLRIAHSRDTHQAPSALKNTTAWMSFTVSGRLIRPSMSSYVPADRSSICLVEVQDREAAGAVQFQGSDDRAPAV